MPLSERKVISEDCIEALSLEETEYKCTIIKILFSGLSYTIHEYFRLWDYVSLACLVLNIQLMP